METKVEFVNQGMLHIVLRAVILLECGEIFCNVFELIAIETGKDEICKAVKQRYQTLFAKTSFCISYILSRNCICMPSTLMLESPKEKGQEQACEI